MVSPFGAVPRLAAEGQGFELTYATGLAVEQHAEDGRLLRIVRAPREDLSLSAAMRHEYETADLDGREKQDRTWFQEGDSPYPGNLPAYAALLVDRDGDLWAQRFTFPGHHENRWGVFEPAGRFLGYLELPFGLDVFEIGRDYVLGLSRDSLYVPSVREYRLHREAERQQASHP